MNTQAVIAIANQKWGSLKGLQQLSAVEARAVEEAIEGEAKKSTLQQTAQQWEASAEGQAQLVQEAISNWVLGSTGQGHGWDECFVDNQIKGFCKKGHDLLLFCKFKIVCWSSQLLVCTCRISVQQFVETMIPQPNTLLL